MEKKDAARLMFLDGWNQKDIAKVIGRSENTISKWAQAEGWKEKRINFDLLEENSSQRIMKLIDYQLRALERKTDAWLKEDPETVQLIERGDLDGLQKLFTTIKREHKEWSDYVTVCKELMDWLRITDIALAKKLPERINQFLNEKRKLL